LAGKLLYASLFASHSVGIVFPVIRELKMSRTKFGAAVLISTVITDIASIILLAVSVQIFRQNQNISHMIVKGTLSIFDHMDSSILGNSFMPVFLLLVLVYLVLSVFLVDRLSRKLLEIFTPGEDILVTIILLIILAVVVVGELFGINLVVGAFIAGLGLARVVKRADMLLFRRFESIGYGFLIPFLFVSIGMKTDFSAFGENGSLGIVLLTVILLVGSKVASGFLAMRITGFNSAAGLTAGLMTVPQLSATLAAAAIGKDIGILNDTFFNAIIILSIVTTLPIPNLVRFVVKKSGLSFPVVEDVSVPRVVKDNELL
jgi:Kef-type K+ transport system membrane component KefB